MRLGVTAHRRDGHRRACRWRDHRVGDRDEIISTRTVLWAAGVLASPLGVILSEEVGAKLDRSRRVIVEPDMSIAGHPEIFVIGDSRTLQPPNWQAAAGRRAARDSARALRGEADSPARLRGKTLPPFRYFDKGNLWRYRARRGCRGFELAAAFRFAGVADLGFRALAVHRAISESFACEITGKSPFPLDL